MLILSIFLIILTAILMILFINKEQIYMLKCVSLAATSVVLFLSSFLFISFKSNVTHFQEIFQLKYVSDSHYFLYHFGLDGLSVYFFFLSALLIFLCVLFILNEESLKPQLLILLVIELFLLIIFSVLDIMLFYVFFEAILIPMFILIGVYGSRERKIRAVLLFFFYTLCGSLLFLLGLLFIYITYHGFDFQMLTSKVFLKTEEQFLWFTFFLAFASKIPMFPFHIWLPEAHVEAPTVGSVLLAGILLKLGVYGFIRFSLTLFPYASLYYSPLIYLLSLLGIVYASFAALRQTDLKRIIAYSSIAHMNLVTLGIFSFNNLGLEGAIIQSVSHGFVSGGMFFLIGILYSRYHSRFLYYYGGLVHTMPLYSALLLFFTLANIALPGTSSFTGEFMLLTGIYKTNIIVGVISTTGVILSGIYSLWLYNRIIFGNIKEHHTVKYADMSHREFAVLFPLMFFILFVGLYPSIFLSYLHTFISGLFRNTL